MVVELDNESESLKRTTATLLVSLNSRMRALEAISGADAIASIIAGISALGGEISHSRDGAAMRNTIELSRAGKNGQLLWDHLKFENLCEGAYMTPVLSQLQNDIALVLAKDLKDAMGAAESYSFVSQASPKDAIPVSYVDFTIGLWFYASVLQNSLEALFGPFESQATAESWEKIKSKHPVLR